MESIQSVGAYEQTAKVRENSDQQNIDQLILARPGQVNPNQAVAEDDGEGLRPSDVFEASPAEKVPQAAVSAPPVGAAIAQNGDDVVVPIDGRGAAVALQEHLKGLLDGGNKAQFAATAQALGVTDLAEFERAVNQGAALQTFAQVDSSRLSFTDQNFNEVSPENLPAVARAQLVIQPSAAAPIAPEVEAPEAISINPNLKLQNDLKTPILENPVKQQDQIQTNPILAQQTDAAPSLG